MLRFEATPHKYYWNDVEVPSVTAILSPLHDWGLVPVDVLEAAREFGVHVHEMVHLYNDGDLIEEELDPALVPRLTAYKLFLSESGFKVGRSEVQVYDEALRVAGTYDFDGDWKKQFWVIDVKSGDAFPPTVGYQTAAYQHAMKPKARRRGCLQLLDNRYRFKELNTSTDFNDFVSILNYRRLLQKHNPRALERMHDYYPN